MKRNIYLISGLFLLSLLGLRFYFQQPTPAPAPPSVEFAANTDPRFNEYWYRGEAEISTYRLKQARYGRMHEGTATLVFVTEDFSADKQVKLDRPGADPEDVVKIMKLNYVKKFTTGIYPYSMMKSVFTPVDRRAYPHTLKVSTSSQEWCGHTFLQLNYRKQRYHLAGFSYFESEGDLSRTLPGVLLEDELLTLIRLAPEYLPEGEIDLIPGSFFSRLQHLPQAQAPAQARMEAVDGEEGVQAYVLEYPSLGRSLRIRFEAAFPHRILGWEESDGRLTTTATRMAELKSAYWQQNRPEDAGLRTQLGLD